MSQKGVNILNHGRLQPLVAVQGNDEGLGYTKNPDFRSGFVSILGNANVGKSTLMNALLGEKLCITSPKPQTTRHRILGIITKPEYQLIFSDTPGMVDPSYKLQEAMMDTVRGATGDADVVVLVTDVYGEDLMDGKILKKLQVTGRPVIVVINKMDVIDPGFGKDAQEGCAALVEPPQSTAHGAKTLCARMLARQRASAAAADVAVDEHKGAESNDGDSVGIAIAEQDHPGGDSGKKKKDKQSKLSVAELKALWAQRLPRASLIFVSARYDAGVGTLLSSLVCHLPPGPLYFPEETFTTRDERFFASEIIREALFMEYQDEVPYSCEVRIDAFKDKKEGKLSVIDATILVTRDSQKAIVIGKGGFALKALGIKARSRLEEFLGRKVFLQLHVKTDKDWRSNADALERYGYTDDNFQ